jgi:hypothetical protein
MRHARLTALGYCISPERSQRNHAESMNVVGLFGGIRSRQTAKLAMNKPGRLSLTSRLPSTRSSRTGFTTSAFSTVEAKKVVSTWVFDPGTCDGHAQQYKIDVTVHFQGR